MYHHPNTHIQPSDERASSTTTGKRAVRPPRRAKKAPPMSLHNTTFGKFYTCTPTFERDEEARLSTADKTDPAFDLGYKYGTRFRKSQPEKGQIPILLDISEQELPVSASEAMGRSSSVGSERDSDPSAALAEGADQTPKARSVSTQKSVQTVQRDDDKGEEDPPLSDQTKRKTLMELDEEMDKINAALETLSRS